MSEDRCAPVEVALKYFAQPTEVLVDKRLEEALNTTNLRREHVMATAGVINFQSPVLSKSAKQCAAELGARRPSEHMPGCVEISSTQYANGASPRPTLNTWIVIIQIFILLIAIFLVEIHLRKVEHRSLSLARHGTSVNCLEV